MPHRRSLSAPGTELRKTRLIRRAGRDHWIKRISGCRAFVGNSDVEWLQHVFEHFGYSLYVLKHHNIFCVVGIYYPFSASAGIAGRSEVSVSRGSVEQSRLFLFPQILRTTVCQFDGAEFFKWRVAWLLLKRSIVFDFCGRLPVFYLPRNEYLVESF